MKKILKILFAVVVVIIIVVILLNVRIKDVEVLGSERQDGAKVTEQIFSSDNDRISILFFIKDLLGIKKEIPYVDTYKVEWVTPFDIKVEVFEKPLVGFIKKDIVNVYFDRDGIISEMSEVRIRGVTEVRGINFDTFEKGKKLSVKNEQTLDVLLSLINSLLTEGFNPSLIEFDRDDNISVYISKICVDLGSKDSIDVKIRRLIDIYPKIKDLSGTLDLSAARESMNDEQYIFKKS